MTIAILWATASISDAIFPDEIRGAVVLIPIKRFPLRGPCRNSLRLQTNISSIISFGNVNHILDKNVFVG